MAMVLAVKKWKHYLLGKKFLIRTDQRSLKFLNEQRLMSEEQFKWATKLIGYNFDIQYRPSKENIVTDALSRQFSFSAISLVQEEEWALVLPHIKHSLFEFCTDFQYSLLPLFFLYYCL